MLIIYFNKNKTPHRCKKYRPKSDFARINAPSGKFYKNYVIRPQFGTPTDSRSIAPKSHKAAKPQS
jgi:hypothetical protein